jgi:hypothetical protein
MSPKSEVDCVLMTTTFNLKRCYLKAKQPCCSSKMSHKGEIESGGGGGPHRQGYTWSSRTQMLRCCCRPKTRKLQLLAEDLSMVADNDNNGSSGGVGGAKVDCVLTMITFNSKHLYLKAKQPCCSSKILGLMTHKSSVKAEDFYISSNSDSEDSDSEESIDYPLSNLKNESIGDKYDLHGFHIINEGFDNIVAREEEDNSIVDCDNANDISEGLGDTAVCNNCPLPRGSALAGPDINTAMAPTHVGSIRNPLDLVYVSPSSLRSLLTLYNNREEAICLEGVQLLSSLLTGQKVVKALVTTGGKEEGGGVEALDRAIEIIVVKGLPAFPEEESKDDKFSEPSVMTVEPVIGHQKVSSMKLQRSARIAAQSVNVGSDQVTVELKVGCRVQVLVNLKIVFKPPQSARITAWLIVFKPQGSARIADWLMGGV